MIDKVKPKKKNQKRQQPSLPRTMADGLIDDEVDDLYGRQKVKARGHRFRGLNDWQKTAIRKFLMDWETAYESDLASGSWKPKVDGGGQEHRIHLRKLEAQDHLRRLEAQIGKRSYAIVMAYAVDQIGPDAISKRGGIKFPSVSDQIKAVVDQVAVFYGVRNAKARDRLMEAIDALRLDRAMVERADGIIHAAERDLARGRQMTSAGMSGEESRKRRIAP